MKKNLFSIFILLIVFTLGACNLPTSSDTGLSLEEQAGTLAAQTLASNQAQQPTETRVPANTPTSIPLPTMTPSPEVSPTPTQKLSVPAKPSLQKYDFFCSWNGANNDLSITIQWIDKANNESGYYIYRNSQQIADLSANSAVYVDLFAVDGGVSVNYGIEAYNNLSRSDQATFTVSCQ
ncbi:MAG: hypothetical protein HN855_04615 [Anaerolineae bacterium]|jgi:hypothetical protein|nr:hypothetical protein [Anaerolineae bacterium]MBT7070378.1 hypothetical protein [Anaerolineae bacterium]MBT7324420.1 hypothetical protein [Anaerolineae bacterium]